MCQPSLLHKEAAPVLGLKAPGWTRTCQSLPPTCPCLVPYKVTWKPSFDMNTVILLDQTRTCRSCPLTCPCLALGPSRDTWTPSSDMSLSGSWTIQVQMEAFPRPTWYPGHWSPRSRTPPGRSRVPACSCCLQ